MTLDKPKKKNLLFMFIHVQSIVFNESFKNESLPIARGIFIDVRRV